MIKIKRVVRMPSEGQMSWMVYGLPLTEPRMTRLEEKMALRELYKKELTQTRIYILGRRIW